QRVPGRLAQDKGTVLEARGNAGRRKMGRRSRGRRCRRGTLGEESPVGDRQQRRSSFRYASAFVSVLVKSTQRKPLGVTLMTSSKRFEDERGAPLSRRALVGAAGSAATILAAGSAFAQTPPPVASGPVAPPSTVTTPPRDFSPRGAPTTYFT